MSHPIGLAPAPVIAVSQSCTVLDTALSVVLRIDPLTQKSWIRTLTVSACGLATVMKSLPPRNTTVMGSNMPAPGACCHMGVIPKEGSFIPPAVFQNSVPAAMLSAFTKVYVVVVVPAGVAAVAF